MYLDDIGHAIRQHIPPDRLPDENVAGLLRLYAVLLMAKGESVNDVDVHNAWAAWMSGQNGEHQSLVGFSDLPDKVKAEDQVFTAAIRAAARDLHNTKPSNPPLEELLYPAGIAGVLTPSTQFIDLYKVMVASSEALVNRRQAVNTFFLTINGALLTADGLVAQNVGTYRLSGVALLVIAIAGVVLCAAWRSLIKSFGQLNGGKFKVINTMERRLEAAVFSAEWEALGRGENPNIYRSFTSREIWVPIALIWIHLAAVVISIVVWTGVLSSPESKASPVVSVTATATATTTQPTQAATSQLPATSQATTKQASP